MRRFWLIWFMFLFVLMACDGESGASSSSQPVAEVTSVPPTAVPPSPTAIPSSTAVPSPTATPLPTVTPEPVKLSYLAYYGGDPAGQWDRANYGRYLESNPLVIIDYTSGNLYRLPVPDGIHTFITGSRQPDIMSSYIVGNLRVYAEQGLFHDLTDLWEEQGWDEVFGPSLKELVTVNGRQYFVPQALQWNPIWYRTDIFDEVGLTPPQSWEDLLIACDTLHAAGYVPIAVSARRWVPPLARWFTILNMRLNGPDFHESLMRGEVSYEDARVRDVFVYWQMMFEHQCFTEDLADYREAAQQIYEGEAAMYNLGEWLAESYEEGIPETFDFFSFPVLDPDLPRGEIIHVYGAYILADSDQLDAAEDFLRYLASAESQMTLVEATGRLVSNQEVDDNLYSDVYLRGREFTAEADHITQLFEFNTYPNIANAALNQFNRFYRSPNDETIGEILAAMEAARLQAVAED